MKNYHKEFFVLSITGQTKPRCTILGVGEIEISDRDMINSDTNSEYFIDEMCISDIVIHAAYLGLMR
jgi:hypothetical protein